MPQQAPAAAGDAQLEGAHFIVLDKFEKMNTQSARQALAETELAWLENLQPIGTNNLAAVPAAMAAIATLTSETVSKFFYANIGTVDYIIAFTAAGALIAVNTSNGATTTIAGDGTFTNPDVTQWQSQRILIEDPTAGYSTWDTITFVKAGGVSPNIVVTAGGSGYVTPPSVTISGGSGSGATAHSVISGGSVVQVVLDNPGSGFKAGDTLTVTFGSGAAAATAKVWPFVQTGTAIAVFGGRVWLANGRVLQYSGTQGFDDFAAANASASFTINDT